MAGTRSKKRTPRKAMPGRIAWQKVAFALMAVATVFGGGFGMGVWIADDQTAPDQVAEAGTTQKMAKS